MPAYTIVVVNEDKRPIQGITVEAIDLSDDSIGATGVTDAAGAVTLTVTGNHFFRPRVRRVSTTVGDRVYTGVVEVQVVSDGGAGPFCYDYLVDKGYTGTEGATHSMPDTTSTFQKYSTVQGAIDAYETAAAQKSMFVCPGTYAEKMTIGTNGSDLHIHGAGRDVVNIGGTNAATHSIGTTRVHFYNLTIDRSTSTAVLFDNAGDANMDIRCWNVRFQNPMAGDHAGSEFHGCDFINGWLAQTGDSPDSVSFYGGSTSDDFDFDTNSITMTQFRFFGFIVRGANDQFLLYRVVNCFFNILQTSSGGTSNVPFRVTDGIDSTTITGNFKSPNAGNHVIHLTTNSGNNNSGVKIIANFSNANSSTSAGRFILQDGTGSANGWHIDISGGKDGAGDYLEDNSGISVEMGNAVGCKFTLTPTNIAKLLISAGSNNTIDSGVLDSSSVGVTGPTRESIALVAKTGAYTLTPADGLVLADASGGAFTLTLPTAVGRTGIVFRVKKTDSSANAVTIDGDGSETIDGGTTAVISTQYEAITIVSDGTTWWVL